ncbi:MAG: hypothetical protein U9Q03_05370 [Patescibacteria group bacterium]|nr:hypothetical protein [Patescibacteria group bacterium]
MRLPAGRSAPVEPEGISVFCDGIPGCDRWSNAPNVNRNGDEANLNANHVRNRYHNTALPSLRESSMNQSALRLERVLPSASS